MHWEKSAAARRSVTLTLRQGRLTEEDEEIDGAVALVLEVEALQPAGLGRNRRPHPISWVGLSSKQITGRVGSGGSP